MNQELTVSNVKKQSLLFLILLLIWHRPVLALENNGNNNNNFHADDTVSFSLPKSTFPTSPRFLQTTSQPVDLDITGGNCTLFPDPVLSTVSCDLTATLSFQVETRVDLTVTLDCDLESNETDTFPEIVQNARTCSCTTTSLDGQRSCGCSVCPQGFGASPIQFDCQDTNTMSLIGSCTVLDCQMTCEGTCRTGCPQDADCGLCISQQPSTTPSSFSPPPSPTSAVRPDEVFSSPWLVLLLGMVFLSI